MSRVPEHLSYTHVRDHFIDGSWVKASSEEFTDVIDPATGQTWGSVPSATTQELDQAVDAATQGMAVWSKFSPHQRAEYLVKIAEEIEARADQLAYTNSLENGSPLAETRGAAANAAGIFRYFSTMASWLEDDVRPFPADATKESLVVKDPVGVCALIAPWNFPINLMVIKLAPALLSGCSVVIKPASVTPLSIRYVIDAIKAAGVPNGVVNMLTGPGSFGDQMVRHPGVAKVAFTGSTPVGRKIAATCGELLRPVTLELGGKSSAIVLPDADLDQMSKVLIRSCLRNTGQTCYISTRIIAPKSRYEEVVEMVRDTIANAQQGDPLSEDTVFGPVASGSQYDSVLEYIASGHEQGARAVTGGQAVDSASLGKEFSDGYFIEPTVFADVTPQMRIAAEEIFGPVITILEYDDTVSETPTDEAVALANNTEFGLGGLVFGADVAQAERIARQVDSGSVGLNFFASNHAAPFGGRHASGMGVEYGPEGLSQYISYKSVHRNAQ